MAIAEIVSINPPVKEALPVIKQFTRAETRDLFHAYKVERPIVNLGKLDTYQAILSGALEIREEILRMLGENHLFEETDPKKQEIKEPSFINRDKVIYLLDKYRQACKIYTEDDLEGKQWGKQVISLEEARSQGRKNELKKLLIRFGQKELVEKIESDFGLNSEPLRIF